MKEYKIYTPGANIWGMVKDDFLEKELNQLASQGWRVVSTVTQGHSPAIKFVMERDKNR